MDRARPPGSRCGTATRSPACCRTASASSPFASNTITGIALLGDTVWVATQAGAVLEPALVRSRELGRASTPVSVNARVDALASDGVTLYALAGFAAHRFDPATRQWVVIGGIGAVRALRPTGLRHRVRPSSGGGIYQMGRRNVWTALNPAPQRLGLDALRRDARPVAAASTRPVRHGLEPSTMSTTGLYRQPDGGAGAWSFAFPPGPPGNDCLNIDVDGARTYVTDISIQRRRPLRRAELEVLAPHADSRTAPTRRSVGRSSRTRCSSTRTRASGCGSWAPVEALVSGAQDGHRRGRAARRRLGRHARHALRARRRSRLGALLSFTRSSALDSSGGHWFGMDSPCTEDPDYALDRHDVLRPRGRLRRRVQLGEPRRVVQ